MGAGNTPAGGPLDDVFLAISDPTRRAVLERLAVRGEDSISDLADPYEMSLPAFSKHIRVLERAGLVTREKRGRTHYCRLNADPLRDAADWLEYYRRFWNQRLDALGAMLEEEAKQERKKKR